MATTKGLSVPKSGEERRNRRSVRADDDINEILGASTGEFEIESDGMDGDGSVEADNDLDELLNESTGEFRLDPMRDSTSFEPTPPRPPVPEQTKQHILDAHLKYISRGKSSAALDDVRERIRALTIEKQKLYRAMQR